jgi:glycosyltransferase involved in cell wall biosynthesis
MKLALIDQSFHWPPTGGSWVDLRETALRLLAHGISPKIFVPKLERGNLPAGRLNADPGIPIETIPIHKNQFNFYTLPRLLEKSVKAWKPDAVMIGDTFYLAPYIIRRFPGIPVYLRIYGHELICLNYMNLCKADVFKWQQQNPGGSVCGCNLPETPLTCWACGLRRMGGTLIGPRLNPVAVEYWTALAWTPWYPRYVKKTLDTLHGIIVYNPFIKNLLKTVQCPIHVVPAGIDSTRFTPSGTECPSGPVRILLTGRMDDQRKGYQSFRDGIQILKNRGLDIEALVTDTRTTGSDSLIHSTGWISYQNLPSLYQSVDIVVCPSIWPEPFGMTALEGMASGLPVVASRIGGFQTSVVDGETGFHYSPGNAQEMADRLETLIRDPDLRHRMGRAGRRRAVNLFNWDGIVERYTSRILKGQTPVDAGWYDPATVSGVEDDTH